MKQEERRIIRTAFNAVHIVIQLALIWYVVVDLRVEPDASSEEILQAVRQMIACLCIMIGTFAIHNTILRLISRRNLPH